MNQRLNFFLQTVVVAIPVVYYIIVWDSLPEKVPVHFGTDRTPDRYGSKASLIAIPAILGIVALLVSALLEWMLSQIQKQEPGAAKTVRRMSWLLVVLFMGIGFLASEHSRLYQSGPAEIDPERLLAAGLNLVFAFMGFAQRDLPQNPYIGIRLPQTLKSKWVWSRTHRFAGRLFLFMGTIAAASCQFLDGKTGLSITIINLVMMVILTIVAASYFAKKEQTF